MALVAIGQLFRAVLALSGAYLTGYNNTKPQTMCRQQTTETATAAETLPTTHLCMAEVMSWLGYSFNRCSVLIRNFLERTRQEKTTQNRTLCAANRQLGPLLQRNHSPLHIGGWQRSCLGLDTLLTGVLGCFGTFWSGLDRKKQPKTAHYVPPPDN